jgi:hypothetical protein
MTESEILEILREEADRLYEQYRHLKGRHEFVMVAEQVLAKHHQTCRIALRITDGKWP